MRKQLSFVILLSAFIFLAGCSSDPSQTPVPTEIGAPAEKGAAVVEELIVQQLAGDEPQFQVLVRGHLTNTCTRISGALAEFEGRTYSISIDTTLLDEVTCKNQQIEFERIVPLELNSALDGQQLVQAGDINESFEVSSNGSTSQVDPSPTPDPGSPAPSSISGVIWHDECINQAGGNEGLDRIGCIESEKTFIADGDQNQSEVGINGVTVNLGPEACPSVGLASTETSSDGSFEFTGLEAGLYCVTIDIASDENLGILEAGVWTNPDDGSGNFTVDLSKEGAAAEVAFGWDYVNQPEPAPVEVPPAEDCIIKAAYYGDVNIPDDTVMEPGEKFTKSWRIRNEGTCTWGSGYKLVFANGDLMSGAPSPLPAAEPGDTVIVSVDLTTPEERGYYQGNWGFRTPWGETFGVGAGGNTPIWVKIVVSFFSGSAPSPIMRLENCGEDLNSDYIPQLLELVNAQRTQRGLPPLGLQEQLSAAAQRHSSDMACNDLDPSKHTGSDGSTYRDRVRDEGYTSFSYITENTYGGNPDYGGTPLGAVNWWMKSKVHRDAILNSEVSDIGIGYAFSTNSTYGAYYTLVFAKPTSP